jgi:hypothetical protein
MIGIIINPLNIILKCVMLSYSFETEIVEIIDIYMQETCFNKSKSNSKMNENTCLALVLTGN